MKDFYIMLVPEGALANTEKQYDADWLSSHGVRVIDYGEMTVVSAFKNTEGILGFFKRLRKHAHRITDLIIQAEYVGKPRVPTTDFWGILTLMTMDYRDEPMDFKVVPTSHYVY